jgi:fungalysin metallopeptidase (M36)/fungalysin/thermolysin propeptide/PA domain-containing protein/immune inhibitor InhA-like protein
VYRRPLVVAAAAALVVSGVVFAAPAAGGGSTGSAPESAADANPDDLAIDYVRQHADRLGVSREDLNDVFVLSSYASEDNGVTHVNLNQRYQGLEVFGGHATVNVNPDGSILFVGNNFVGLQEAASATASAADLDAVAAVEAAAQELELAEPVKVLPTRTARTTAGSVTTLTGGNISDSPIKAKLGWQPTDDGLRQAWQLVIDDSSDVHLWNATVDANTGRLLNVDDWTSHGGSYSGLKSLLNARAGKTSSGTLATRLSAAQPRTDVGPLNPVDDGSSYRVLQVPTESPNDGPRELVTNPAEESASPFGWHDTNGVDGPEFTRTQGNNAYAYLDQDANNVPDLGGPPFQPRTGQFFAFSNSADMAYKRLTREVAVPAAGGNLTFWTNYDIEADWDHMFVEARTAGGDDWTTLPDANGNTNQATGQSCPLATSGGWRTLHPHLDHYQTQVGTTSCQPAGTTGDWNAKSGTSGGYQQWSIDLSEWAGGTVEVSIAYATDWATLNDGVAIDDVTLPDGTSTSFEDGLGGWTVTGPPPGTGANANNWIRTDAAAAGSTDGGPGLDFDYPADLTEHSQTYRDAAVTNLFYLNNTIHDVMYGYGFDEPSGNFQTTNYSGQGTGGDFVRAEAADGAGTNNANFSTPANDGGAPRMQMFLWPGTQFGQPNQFVVNGAGSFGANFARFSAAPTNAGQAGEIVNAGNGCSASQYPAPLPSGDWIALVTTGTCTNVVKGQVAQAQGASALVVTGTTAILSGAITEPEVTIPVISLSTADGNAVRAALPTSGTVRKHPDHPGIRDGDLDNGIIIHEYGHGISLRLTGGPGINCLGGTEQMGEGWSDYYAITMLLDPELDDPDGARGMGPYALFQDDRHGAGIRPRPYSRTWDIQPFSYDSIKTGGWLANANGQPTSLAAPHGIGHGWAAVLLDLTWDLIDRYGFNPNIYEDWSTGGNNLALQLVTDGLKMQGCNPTFVVARDAILAADQALTDGENQCTIWASFARRGVGFSAVGGGTSRDDGAEAFDTHPDCVDGFAGQVQDEPTINPVAAGRTVPMMFDRPELSGLDVLASNSPFSRRVDCQTLKVPSDDPPRLTPKAAPVTASTPGDAGLSRNTGGRYLYPWQTEEAWVDTCREFVLTLDNGEQHRAYFQLVPPE